MRDIGTRMKENYESVSKTKLICRMPVAIRVDGRSFHTFTKKFHKPFDEVLIQAMQLTMLDMCKNIQGCVFGYQQSDEITLILVDYEGFDQASWFDNEVQKICSISASMATLYFNKNFSNAVNKNTNMSNEDRIIYNEAIHSGAMFDSRCFNIPKEEVANLVYWRQQDAIRNAIEMVGRAHYSHKQLFKKNTTDIKQMLLNDYGINFDNEFETYKKIGTACIKKITKINNIERSKWCLDMNMPIIKNEDRAYIESLIYVGE